MKGIDGSRDGTYTVNAKKSKLVFKLKASCNKAGHCCLTATDRVC